MDRFRQLSQWTWLNVFGLVMAAAGMMLQIAAGSELYPTFTGPIVLVATAGLVVLGPANWTRFVGLIVPVVLAVGAVVAAAMTSTFIDQLTDLGHAPIVVGSLMHVIGLTAAITGGVGMLRGHRGTARSER
jgi:hypothetical protein